MDFKRTNTYVVTSKYDSWGFLNGYSCKSQDIDHFLRHLGYRFKSLCTMDKLNNAYQSGDISIKKKRNQLFINKEHNKSITIVDEYYDSFGYVLEVNDGTILEPNIIKKSFATDSDAHEWFNSQN